MNQQPEPRVPPQAPEVEETILGAMLLDTEAMDIVISTLKADDFYRPAHQEIYKIILRLYDQGIEIDAMTVEHEANNRQVIDKIGGQGYLYDLTRSASSAQSMDYH
ncbi:MAG: hypothetical protein LAT56_14710, partial [Wenzhouxiangella sp.]|nr:hypothetical protein [Wenzhouxiangella sp.]